jgi:putative ABC transport system substrate-binding protein
MQFEMKRREFITLLGGAATTWPLSLRAQQRERMRRIGVLMPLAADDAAAQARNAAFLQGLQKLGWTVGQNVQIEYRWSGGNDELTRRYAAELATLAPEAILATGSASMAPLLQATRTVPIVFAIVPDPVGAGFVDSLARPGGNATGFTSFDYGIGAKWVELLKEIAPRVTRAAVLRDPAIAGGIGVWGAIQTAAPSLALEVSPVNMRDAGEIERALTAFARSPEWGPDCHRQSTGLCSSRSDR